MSFLGNFVIKEKEDVRTVAQISGTIIGLMTAVMVFLLEKFIEINAKSVLGGIPSNWFLASSLYAFFVVIFIYPFIINEKSDRKALSNIFSLMWYLGLSILCIFIFTITSVI